MFNKIYEDDLTFGIIVILLMITMLSIILMLCFKKDAKEYREQMIIFRDENNELKWELNEVDQMICNNEVQNAETETN